MPIGKNAIKRVENNGYSNVKTEAPDMINSTVISGTSKEVMDMVEKSVNKAVKPVKKAVEPATEAVVEAPAEPVVEVKVEAKKTTAKKSTTTKKAAPKKPAKNNFEIIRFGDEMPIHLL